MEWLLGNGNFGCGWSLGFCRSINYSCIKIFIVLNIENIIVSLYLIKNKNLLSSKISVGKFSKFLFFCNDYKRVFFLKVEYLSEEFGVGEGGLGIVCIG